MNSLYSNARYPFPDRTDTIDIDFNHEVYGVIPMTITQEEYPELWEIVSAGPIDPYTPTQA